MTFLFDYGGTLDTSACHWFYVFQEAYAVVGVTGISETDLRQAYVTGERALAKERIVLPEDTFYDMLVKKVSIQVNYLAKERKLLLLPSSDEQTHLVERIASFCDEFARKQTSRSLNVLKELKKKYKLIMVSNFYGNLRTVLREYGLLEFFSEIIESSVVGVRKPDPAIWRMGVDAAQCSASSCVAVGDSYGKDIVPASSINCQTVWFKGKEWEEKTFDETLPTHIITSLEDLLRLY